MRIFLGSDHGGYKMKEYFLQVFSQKAQDSVVDCGTFSEESVDYPEIAKKVCDQVIDEEGSLGILVCGTGIGMSIVANKIPGIRAALVYNKETGKYAREHNDANILCFGGRQISEEEAQKSVEAFLAAQFEGGRHERRKKSLQVIEQSCGKNKRCCS